MQVDSLRETQCSGLTRGVIQGCVALLWDVRAVRWHADGRAVRCSSEVVAQRENARTGVCASVGLRCVFLRPRQLRHEGRVECFREEVRDVEVRERFGLDGR